MPESLCTDSVHRYGNSIREAAKVFIPHATHGWCEGVILSLEDAGRTALLEVIVDGVKEIQSCATSTLEAQGNWDEAFLRSDDLTVIRPLSTAAVLTCLRWRHASNHYYTRAGQTLVAINPFKNVDHLYDNAAIDIYANRSHAKVKLEPHIFGVASEVHEALRMGVNACDQSVIISGESGAGKTVSTKHVLKYLVTVAHKSVGTMKKDLGYGIEERILSCNPILEAFGNAKTKKNDNSSRFGKYIQLHFDMAGSVVGASMQTYLLEKTRIVCTNKNELNFHIIYQMLAGADERFYKDIMLSKDVTYRIGESAERDIESDKSDWSIMSSALYHIGLSESEQLNIFKLLSAILNLTNVEFVQDAEDKEVIKLASSEDEQHLNTAAQLLGIDDRTLSSCLTHRTLITGGMNSSRRRTVIYKPCSLEGTYDRVHCLAKLVYSQLFDWLVRFINVHLEGKRTYHRTIGILDIYGFESFERNSLEQLCINYANERLQQHFVGYFMKDLQTEYSNEKIELDFLQDFRDNRPCVDLLECNPGVFALLNEQCHLNRPSIAHVLADEMRLCLMNVNMPPVNRSPSNKDFTKMTPPKVAPKPTKTMRAQLCDVLSRVDGSTFTVQHYASKVVYSIDGIIDKNKDNVPPEFLEQLQGSDNRFVAEMFNSIKSDAPGRKKKTVLAKFKSSLDSLMNTLSQTQPHYVRCIKPTQLNISDTFEGLYVLSQLEACGVVETVQICRQAYSARLDYREFVRRYAVILRYQAPRPLGVTCPQRQQNLAMIRKLDTLFRRQTDVENRHNASPDRTQQKIIHDDESDTEEVQQYMQQATLICSQIMKIVFPPETEEDAGEDNNFKGQFGVTKLFLKQHQLEKLESHRDTLFSCFAATIQARWRLYLKDKHARYVKLIVKVQSYVRGFSPRMHYKRKRSAAITIQRHYLDYRHRYLTAMARANVTTPMVYKESLTNIYRECGDSEDVLSVQACPFYPDVIGRRMDDSLHDDDVIHPSETLGLPKSLTRISSTIYSGFEAKDRLIMTSVLPNIDRLEAADGVISRRLLSKNKVSIKINRFLKNAEISSNHEALTGLAGIIS